MKNLALLDFLAYFDNVRRNICSLVLMFWGCSKIYGIWEPLRGMGGDLKQENVFDFEIVSFKREPFRIQYRGFFTKINEEIRYLFTLEERSLVHVSVHEKCPEGFILMQVNDNKNEVIVRDTIEDKDYVLRLGETSYRKDRFYCTIRDLKDDQVYTFSDKSLRWLEEHKTLSLSYKENELVLLLQRKDEIPLAFRFVLES